MRQPDRVFLPIFLLVCILLPAVSWADNLSDSNTSWDTGKALWDEKNYENALIAFNNSTVFNPANDKAWFYKGLTLARMGRNEEAIAAYETVSTLDPGNAAVWFNKGTNLAGLNRTDEALVAYNKAIELDPEYAFPMQNI